MRIRRLAVVVLLAALAMPATVQAAPPILVDDRATTDEDTPVIIDVFANDSDPDGDILDIASVTQPAHGTIQQTSPFGEFQYRPRLNYYGSDQFFYSVSNGTGGTVSATVSITIRPVNDPPNAGDRVYSVVEDGSVTVLLQANDPDKEACFLFFTIESGPVHGALGPLTDAGCNPNGDMVDVVYSPDPGFAGDDFFTYCVFDGVDQDCARAFISITPVNDLPVAQAGSATTASNTPVAITLSGLDPDNCELVFAVAGQPANGTLSSPGTTACTPSGTGGGSINLDTAPITYTPGAGFTGSDSFTFTVSDGTAVSTPATVTINVVPPPTVHVGDLDAVTVKGSGSWQATVTIRIDTFSHAARSGAIVRATWANGLTSSCTTNAAGTCSVGSGSIAQKGKSTTFQVTSVTVGDLVYNPSANHDPDGSSNGTLIAISRP